MFRRWQHCRFFTAIFIGTSLDKDGLIEEKAVQPEMAQIDIADAILIERCRQGDSAAMERLIIKYQNRIYNVILKICTNPDDAAELTQETFVKIIQSINTFESKSSFYTWAFRIAVNLTLNYCQRNARFALKSLDSGDFEHSERESQVLRQFLSDDSSPDPAMAAQSKELCEIAVKSLMELDDEQRIVIVLRDIEGMNYNQIAEVLQIKLGTVRSRLSRARSKLREIMEAML
jgi:RNA polymerase sigma-70 factor (ECF subfamily)